MPLHLSQMVPVHPNGLPPIPTWSDNESPPTESARICIARDMGRRLHDGSYDGKPYLRMKWWDRMIEPKEGGCVYNSQGQDEGHKVHHLYGKPLPEMAVEHRRFWKRLDFQSISPHTVYQQEIEITHGVTTTDTLTYGFEFGAEGGGFSAKASVELSHSVSITDQVTEKITRTITGSAGNQLIYTLWQLIDELVVVDASSHPVVLHLEDRAAVLGINGDERQEHYTLEHNRWKIPSKTKKEITKPIPLPA